MKKIKLRLARTNDAKKVTELFIHSRFLGNGDPDVYSTIDVKEYISRKHSIVVVAEEDKKVIGALWIIVYPEYILTGACCVIKEFRKSGVYKLLSEWRTNYALKHNIHWLETMTASNNKRMQSIFKKQGYIKKERFIRYYKEI